MAETTGIAQTLMLKRLRLLLQRDRTATAVEPCSSGCQPVADGPAVVFCGDMGGPYSWQLSPAMIYAGWETLPNISARVGGSVVGWIQNIIVERGHHRATVGHFAVDRALVRRGHGRDIARVLGAELHRRFGIVEIVFSERSSKYESAGYEFFFVALGAVKLPAKPGWRPDWQWQLGTEVRADN